MVGPELFKICKTNYVRACALACVNINLQEKAAHSVGWTPSCKANRFMSLKTKQKTPQTSGFWRVTEAVLAGVRPCRATSCRRGDFSWEWRPLGRKTKQNQKKQEEV